MSSLIELLDERVGLTNLAQIPGELRPLAKDVRAEAETLVDHVFQRLLILVVPLVGGFLGGA